ncbi:MAG: chaperone protein DnaJ 1 [Acidimicrobiia bacterium]
MDLYGALDLAPSATAAEIERAYLRLARRYHPGINPGDRRAEERYRQVQEAYDVLGSPERRREYDQRRVVRPATTIEASISFEGFDFGSGAHGHEAATFSEMFADVFQDAARRVTTSEQGGALELTMQLSFEDAVRGGTFPFSVVRQDRCPGCAGSGRTAMAPVPCSTCHGQGALRWARGHMVFTKPCDACHATGRVTARGCQHCAGSGLQARSEVVTLALPPGIDHGARLVVPGRGHAGAHGGPAGDLYVTVEVLPHRIFRREGRDLMLTLPVAVHEAALGAKVQVPTLDGSVTVRIPPGTASGARVRVRGHGVPAGRADAPGDAGDLIADVQIVLPPVRDERSKALLREFAALNPVDVRAGLFDGDLT